MRAVLHTGQPLPWAAPLGLPWPLLPVGNRPWIEYWVEWCVEQEIRSLQVVLGEGDWEVEHYLGDGARWGVDIGYSFVRDGADPDAYLRRDPARWQEGLFLLRRPLFRFLVRGLQLSLLPAKWKQVRSSTRPRAPWLPRWQRQADRYSRSPSFPTRTCTRVQTPEAHRSGH